MVHTAHLVVGGILKIDSTYFHSNTNHANVPELKELLQDTRKPEQDFPLLAVVLFPSRDCNSTNPFLVEELALVCSRTYPTSTRITDHVLVAEVYSIQCLIIAWQPCREACTEGHSLGDKEDDAGYDCSCSNDRTSISQSPAQLPDDSHSSRSSVGPIKYFLRSQGARAVLTGETAFSSTSRPY